MMNGRIIIAAILAMLMFSSMTAAIEVGIEGLSVRDIDSKELMDDPIRQNIPAPRIEVRDPTLLELAGFYLNLVLPGKAGPALFVYDLQPEYQIGDTVEFRSKLFAFKDCDKPIYVVDLYSPDIDGSAPYMHLTYPIPWFYEFEELKIIDVSFEFEMEPYSTEKGRYVGRDELIGRWGIDDMIVCADTGDFPMIACDGMEFNSVFLTDPDTKITKCVGAEGEVNWFNVVEEPALKTCIDSDGASPTAELLERDRWTSGKVTTESGVWLDDCWSSGLYERRCDGNSLKTVYLKCITGETCVGSAKGDYCKKTAEIEQCTEEKTQCSFHDFEICNEASNWKFQRVTTCQVGQTCDSLKGCVCIDSDGKDRSTVGTVGYNEDYCIDGKNVREYICSSGVSDYVDLECGAAQVCEDGRCIIEVIKPTCDDGVMNQKEEGVDCGGPCTACDPGFVCNGNEVCDQGEDDRCADCVKLPPGYCEEDGNCEGAERCLSSVHDCVECLSTSDCSGASVCRGNACTNCQSDAECAVYDRGYGAACLNKKCVAIGEPSTGCFDNKGCGSNEYCKLPSTFEGLKVQVSPPPGTCEPVICPIYMAVVSNECGGEEECGNLICEKAEWVTSSCPLDCVEEPVCGNGICDGTDTAANCPEDGCQIFPCEATEECPADFVCAHDEALDMDVCQPAAEFCALLSVATVGNCFTQDNTKTWAWGGVMVMVLGGVFLLSRVQQGQTTPVRKKARKNSRRTTTRKKR